MSAPTANDLSTIRARALELMEELGRSETGHSLQDLGWTFRFDRAKRRLGLCRYHRRGRGPKTISLSAHYARTGGWALMEDVVRHEIAHALDFEERGRTDHGPGWEAIARRVGADPTRLYERAALDDPPSKYVGICSACGHRQPFYRRVTRAYACPDCCNAYNGGHFTERFRLRIVERRTGQELVVDLSRPKKYTATCPSCGRTKHFARKPAYAYACKSCCDRHAGGKYDERYEWVVRRNY